MLNTKHALAQAQADRLTALGIAAPWWIDDDSPRLQAAVEEAREFRAKIREAKERRDKEPR